MREGRQVSGLGGGRWGEEICGFLHVKSIEELETKGLEMRLTLVCENITRLDI
jgi:hypothetical protein